ncbi:MAG: winged helix-turn-helix domain-containing protein [Candidatus Thorarchaeota archaeon]
MANKESKEIPKLQPNFKLWLEHEGVYVFGPGAYALLSEIKETGSITNAAKSLKMSYRYAWGVIRKIERTLGIKLIESYKGGKEGGGGARVTEYGIALMKLYSQVNDSFSGYIESMD